MSFTQTESSQHSLTPIVYEGSAGPVGGKSTGVGLRFGVGPGTTLAEALTPQPTQEHNCAMSRQAGLLTMSTRANAKPIHTNTPSFSTHHSLCTTDQRSYSFNYKTRQIPSLTAPFTIPLRLSTTQASKTAGGNSGPMGVKPTSGHLQSRRSGRGTGPP